MTEPVSDNKVHSVVLPSDPHARAEIKKAVMAISDEMALIEGHKGLIKAEVEAICAEYKLPKKFINKMAKAYHLKNLNAQKDEFEEFEEMYREVLEKKHTVPEVFGGEHIPTAEETWLNAVQQANEGEIEA